jgi:hypothetical protein
MTKFGATRLTHARPRRSPVADASESWRAKYCSAGLLLRLNNGGVAKTASRAFSSAPLSGGLQVIGMPCNPVRHDTPFSAQMENRCIICDSGQGPIAEETMAAGSGISGIALAIHRGRRTILRHFQNCIDPAKYSELKKLGRSRKKRPENKPAFPVLAALDTDLPDWGTSAEREARILLALTTDGHSIENVRAGISISLREQAALKCLGIDPSSTMRFRVAVLAKFDALAASPEAEALLAESRKRRARLVKLYPKRFRANAPKPEAEADDWG